jgi:hypothetical protein
MNNVVQYASNGFGGTRTSSGFGCNSGAGNGNNTDDDNDDDDDENKHDDDEKDDLFGLESVAPDIAATHKIILDVWKESRFMASGSFKGKCLV